MALNDYIKDPRYAKLAQTLPTSHLKAVHGMLDSGMDLNTALTMYGLDDKSAGLTTADRAVDKIGFNDQLEAVGKGSELSAAGVVGNAASMAGTGFSIGGPIGAAVGGGIGLIGSMIDHGKQREAEVAKEKKIMKAKNAAEVAQSMAEKNSFAKGGENKAEGDGAAKKSGVLTGKGGIDNNLVNLNKGDYVINSAALYADYLAGKPHAVKLVADLSKKGILTKTATGIKMSKPNASVSAGEILVSKDDAKGSENLLRSITPQSGTSEVQGNKTPKAGEGDFAKLATAAGVAQTLAGLVQSSKVGDVKELEVSGDVKRATDMILKASEQGIDPALMAREERNIEARRRSALYDIEGSGQTAGTRFNQKVATNIAANRAGQDLTISADDRKYDKTRTAASALLSAGDHKMRVKMQNQNLQMQKAMSAADMIGAGIDNIAGSYMLREQMKAEKERNEYNKY